MHTGWYRKEAALTRVRRMRAEESVKCFKFFVENIHREISHEYKKASLTGVLDKYSKC
jgi:hypothetical protein